LVAINKEDKKLETNMRNEDRIPVGFLYFGILAYGLIGLVISYVWQGDNLRVFIGGLFSTDHLGQDLLYGFIAALALQLLIFASWKKDILYFPDTSDSRSLMTFIKETPAQSVILAFVTGVCEEFLFRGVLQTLLTNWTGSVFGWALATILFGLLHAKQYKGAPYSLAHVFILSAITGILFWQHGTLWAAIVAHSINNACVTYWVLSKKLQIRKKE
jgi:membrane protease YdiL (CAAX protease family)